MADNEQKTLEDFFAKKDKKKKKEKTKRHGDVVPASAVLTVLSGESSSAGAYVSAAGVVGPTGGPTPAGPTRKAKKDKEKLVKSEGVECPVVKEEEEWKEFEQKETDYSGLRIQALQVGEDLPEEDGESKDEKESEVGDGMQRDSERGEGPWNKSGGNTPATSVEVSEPRSTPGVVGGVYRPPGYRSTPNHPRRGPQAPPEISSEAQFPSLQAATKTESRRERDLERTFETVKHRMRAREDDKSKPLELELGNQFAVLGD
uniref:protein CDV3 homolog n=1 Tax=Myxine glutinosa TaxID=7769 RepID=UPI00358EAAC5